MQSNHKLQFLTIRVMEATLQATKEAPVSSAARAAGGGASGATVGQKLGASGATVGQKLGYRASGAGSGRGVAGGRSCGVVPAAMAAISRSDIDTAR